MADRNLDPNTAAMVAAQLTQAQMALTGGLYAGRKPGIPTAVRAYAVERTYLRFLQFIENGAVVPEDPVED